jgi:hypothetical protein
LALGSGAESHATVTPREAFKLPEMFVAVPPLPGGEGWGEGEHPSSSIHSNCFLTKAPSEEQITRVIRIYSTPWCRGEGERSPLPEHGLIPVGKVLNQKHDQIKSRSTVGPVVRSLSMMALGRPSFVYFGNLSWLI